MTALSLSGVILPVTDALASTHTAPTQVKASKVTALPIGLQGKKVKVHTNAKWRQLTSELQRLEEHSSLITSEQQKAKLTELVHEYDGAQVDYDILDDNDFQMQSRKGHSFSEKWVNGGLNDFAYKKSALPDLQAYYGKTAGSTAVLGAGGGGAIGGWVGAIVGAVGGTVASGYFRDAQKDMKKWINKGSSKGGCRVTLTDEFPISYLSSQKQTKIKKL